MFSNNQINPIGNSSAFSPAGINSSAYTNLLSGTSGLTGMNLGTGSDQIKLGSEASNMLGTGNNSSLLSMLSGSTGTTGTTGTAASASDPTSFIMQMISKLTTSSNTIASQLMSSMSGTGTTGTTGTSSTGTGTATTTSAGKLDTTGVQNVQRAASGSNEGDGLIISSGTVNNTMGTTEITSNYVRADGKPSAAGDGAYKVQSGKIFENKCPCCGKKGVLSYQKGGGCPEGMFFCDSKKGGCDADFSVISGKEHTSGSKYALTPAASGAAKTTSTGGTTSSSVTGSAGGDSVGTGTAGATGYDSIFAALMSSYASLGITVPGLNSSSGTSTNSNSTAS